jgi:hypothetical protein
MTAIETKPTRPSQLYHGETTCHFVPEYGGLNGDGLNLAKACYAAPVGEHLPWLVLADWLAERDDGREWWVREFVRWEEIACTQNTFATKGVPTWDDRQASFAKHTTTESGWRWVGLCSGVSARWCPDGYGVGPQHETWSDVRVKSINTWSVMWACRLVAGSQAYAAWRQASAAWSQASAAGRQAYAAGSQADAAWSQADAAWSQADAAWSQAFAAWRQASAAGRQADAAWRQASAAGRQAYAAGRQADAAGRQAYACENQCREWLVGFWGLMSQHTPQ